MVGIQKAGKFRFYDGAAVLSELVDSVEDKRMPIFCWDFAEFPAVFTGALGLLESFERMVGLPAKNSFALWWPTHDHRFSVLDLDLCGPIHMPVVRAIQAMFSRNTLADRGWIFLTQMKGMELKGDIKELKAAGMCGSMLRYGMMPLMYMSKAAEAGYALQLDHVTEYRDLMPGRKNAATMIHYGFRFSYVGPAAAQAKLIYSSDALAQLRVSVAMGEGEKRFQHGNYSRLID